MPNTTLKVPAQGPAEPGVVERVGTGQAAGGEQVEVPARGPVVQLRGRVNQRRSWVAARIRVG
jgi:hypothetical protein